MARWVTNFNTWTPTAVADATNMTAQGFHALQGGSSTQFINCLEFFLNGQATSSTVNQVAVARDSTVFSGATSNAVLNAALHPSTAALAAAPLAQSVGSSTLPQRSATLYLLSLGFNAFGGLVRWQAAPGEEVGMLGNTASLGEISISTLAGAGKIGTHIIYEPFVWFACAVLSGMLMFGASIT